MLTAPETREMFPGLHGAELVDAFDAYKGALNDAPRRAGVDVVKAFEGVPASLSPVEQLEAVLGDDSIVKALSADTLGSLQTELQVARTAQADLFKDVTLTSPLSTGLVAYDLEAPAKMLTPRSTPLRNIIPRQSGQGLARKFKRITGISNLGVGGVSNLSPFISDSSTASFGSLTLRRGAKISYASDEKSISYQQMGLSDMVTWSAEFQGRGYQDIRQLSQTALLWASMHADELALLGARGTGSGFVGSISTPVAPTGAARNAGTGETGNSANIATLSIKVSARSLFGETLPSPVLSFGGLSAATGKVVDVTITDVNGALGYNVYVSTDATNYFFAGTTGYNLFTVNFTGGGTGGTINSGNAPLGAATDSDPNGFDGLAALLLDPTQSGYLTRLNAALSTSQPGIEYQNAFASMYDIASGGVLADPDTILMNGFDRKQLSEALKAGSTTPGYRLQIMQSEVDGVRLGSLVSHIVNEVTGKEVPITVHPRLPQGNSLIMSWTLPFPDSEIGSCYEYTLPQDYMAVDWPVIQHTYDASSYWLGALVPYATRWSGAICGIKKA